MWPTCLQWKSKAARLFQMSQPGSEERSETAMAGYFIPWRKPRSAVSARHNFPEPLLPPISSSMSVKPPSWPLRGLFMRWNSGRPVAALPAAFAAEGGAGGFGNCPYWAGASPSVPESWTMRRCFRLAQVAAASRLAVTRRPRSAAGGGGSGRGAQSDALAPGVAEGDLFTWYGGDIVSSPESKG